MSTVMTAPAPAQDKGRQSGATPPPERPPGTKARRRLRVILGGLALGILVLVGLDLLSGRGPDVPVVQGRPLNFWLRDLAAGTAERREAAREVLRSGGGGNVDCLVRILARDPSFAGRLLLRSEGWLPRGLSTQLHRRFRPYETALDRTGAAMALGLLGNTNAMVIASLGEALHSGDLRLASAAAASLGRLGPPGTDRLLAALPKLSGGSRLAALAGIEPTHTTAAVAVPVILQAALGEPNSRTLPVYGHALAGFGREAVAVVYAALSKTEAEPRERLVGLAVTAAGESDGFLLAWDEEWAVQDPPTKVAALGVLQRVQGRSIRRAIRFAHGICDPDAQVREAGLRGLITVRQNARRAVPVLMDGCRSGSNDVRVAAIEALGQLGPVAIEASPRLEALCELGDPRTRAAARQALRAIGGTPP